ncbi:MAG: sigma-70 family RNA polymerase sigma factor [Planctomycetota bacterium]
MDEPSSSPIDLETISQLVIAARDGNIDAHDQICRLVRGNLTRLADQQLDPPLRRKMNPSDVVQTTLARMVRSFDDFRGSSTAEFYGWLNTILTNEIHSSRRDLHRHRRDIRREEDASDEALTRPDTRQQTPLSLVQHRDTLTRFREAVSQLPADYAEVIELRGIQELPFSTIASRMGRSEDAVSKLWGRALVKLQQELSKVDDSFS